MTSEPLRKEIFIECSPDTLFSFFIDPNKMVRWIGRQILLEPKVSGKYRIDIDGENIALGEYKEIIQNEKIVMTWGWEKSELMPPGSSTVEFLLSPLKKGTLLQLTHYNIPSEKLTSNSNGWTHYMDRLQRLSQGDNIGEDPWSTK
ncbi:SRPBCC family protein [Bacillus sp. 2205SS5-2]|uniref:SRPBCC family protein n=1 Tax=Bacillus sp. 2205SS5-2 TaxID=3109031 RepID=UPI003007C997